MSWGRLFTRYRENLLNNESAIISSWKIATSALPVNNRCGLIRETGRKPQNILLGMKIDHMKGDLLKSTVVPQFFPAHWLQDAPDIVHTPFPSRVRIGYVIRKDGAYTYVMQGELEASGLSLAQIHDAAVENLRTLPCPDLNVAQTPGGPEAWLPDSADNFNAVRLLMPNLQRMLFADLGEPFYAVLPCRDWFTCWSKKQSPEWQTKNKAEAMNIFLNDEYNLTPDVFVFEGGKFTISEIQEGA